MGKRGSGWRVLIVDDDLNRSSDLASDCKTIPDVEAVAVAPSLQEAADVVSGPGADVVIIDLRVGAPVPLAELGRAARQHGASVLGITSGQSPSVLAEAANHWASGFLSSEADASVLGHAIRVVRTGAFYMDPRQARDMVEELDALREVDARGTSGESLTPREKEVLRLLSEGLSARQMARRLDLSERTINTHVANVYRKLNVTNRVQAVRQAIRLGLVDERT